MYRKILYIVFFIFLLNTALSIGGDFAYYIKNPQQKIGYSKSPKNNGDGTKNQPNALANTDQDVANQHNMGLKVFSVPFLQSGTAIAASSSKEEKPEEIAPPPEENAEAVNETGAPLFSDSDLKILKNLAIRRKKLEEWENEIKLKGEVLAITEERIETKIAELKELEGKLEKIMQEYKNKEDEKIKNLISIYEKMKPKDAAAIFTKMDINTLLLVASGMKNTKLALVMASMPPDMAKVLTVRLVNYRKLP